MAKIRIKRGTLAQLNTAATEGGLFAGEPYLVTDLGQMAVGVSPSEYVMLATEGGGGAGDYLDLPVSATPGTPSTDFVRIFGRKVAGRVLPAYVGPAGLDSALQPLLARNKVAWFNPPGNSTAVHQHGMVVTGTGTATSAAVISSNNVHQRARRIEYAVTSASATAVAGLRSAVLQYSLGHPGFDVGGFTFIARFGPSRGLAASGVSRRYWAGFTSVSGAPTDSDPSTWAVDGIGVGADSDDENFQIMHRQGSGGMFKIDTGINKVVGVADNTLMYELVLFSVPKAWPAQVHVQFTKLSVIGAPSVFSTTITADSFGDTKLPSVSQLLTWQIWNSVGGVSSVVGMAISSIYIETDW